MRTVCKLRLLKCQPLFIIKAIPEVAFQVGSDIKSIDAKIVL